MKLAVVLSPEVAPAVLALGLMTGAVYGLLGVGLVLIYRSSRVINFAHGEVGAFGATVVGVAVLRWRVPYWIAFVLGVAVAAGAGCIVEAGAVRRLRRAPKLMSMVATLGFAQVLRLVAAALAAEVLVTTSYPQPPWVPGLTIGALSIDPAHVAMLLLSPPLVLGLALFLNRSRFGLALRGAADDSEVADLAGVPAARMSILAWAIAAAMSAFTAILVFPGLGFGAQLLGPTQLLRALAAGVVARMSSLPVALGAGVVIGVLEEVVAWNYPGSGLVEVALFAVVLASLLVRRTAVARDDRQESWLALQPWRQVPERLGHLWLGRNLGRVAAGTSIFVAVLLPALLPNRTAVTLASIASFAVIGLSISVITGLAGQLSLGQFALAGLGATASYHVASRTGNYVLSFAAAGLGAGAVSVLVGLPALRIRGLMLAVTTLSFAVMAQGWLLRQPWALGDGVNPGRPVLRSIHFDSGRRYYFFCLVVLLASVWLVARVRTSGFGRCLVALRDDEDRARAFSIPATRRRIEAFAVAGFLAGIGGALYGHTLSALSGTTFSVVRNSEVVAMTAIGGMATLAGPVLGALYVVGVPAFVPLDSAGLAASAAGWLVLILYIPEGVGGLIRPLRDRLLAYVGTRRSATDGSFLYDADIESPTPASRRFDEVTGATVPPMVQSPADKAVLEGSSLSKSFGGVCALDSIDIRVDAGEIVGLVGPNGAGKTTLFELLSGFLIPDGGRVVLNGRDVTGLRPEARARLGLARSFQEVRLFDTMTVLDTVSVALERGSPTSLFGTLTSTKAAEGRKQARARQFVEVVGLGPSSHRRAGELSTGTRRMVELACMLALEPRVLLLDEPSAGIAEAEVEALSGFIGDMVAHLGCGVLLVEHDLRLVETLVHRLVALDAGRVVADGSFLEVVEDPSVREAWLGPGPVHGGPSLSSPPTPTGQQHTPG